MVRSLGVLAVLSVMLVGVSAAYAHDADITTSFNGVGAGVAEQVSHGDADPWAGWVNVSVTNTGSDPWGDFHFEIYDPIGGQNISNVDWQEAIGLDPYSTQTDLSWAIDNTPAGAKIDLYYYNDPVLPGETAEFHVYNVNPDMLSFFGIMFYPTPVPEPGSLFLLALGAVALKRSR